MNAPSAACTVTLPPAIPAQVFVCVGDYNGHIGLGVKVRDAAQHWWAVLAFAAHEPLHTPHCARCTWHVQKSADVRGQQREATHW